MVYTGRVYTGRIQGWKTPPSKGVRLKPLNQPSNLLHPILVIERPHKNMWKIETTWPFMKNPILPFSKFYLSLILEIFQVYTCISTNSLGKSDGTIRFYGRLPILNFIIKRLLTKYYLSSISFLYSNEVIVRDSKFILYINH